MPCPIEIRADVYTWTNSRPGTCAERPYRGTNWKTVCVCHWRLSVFLRIGEPTAGRSWCAASQCQARLSRDGDPCIVAVEGTQSPAVQSGHEGKVAVEHSDTRWCSDGFEVKCDSGQTVNATFAKDCCDREILTHRAWEGKGLPGEPVREMLIEAVEKRFGHVDGIPEAHALKFIFDNGDAYIAAKTRQIASQLGLKPVKTPVCSPQRNGVAERFVNTFKRDYVSRMDLANARTVMAQMAAAFEHFNEVHPHSA